MFKTFSILILICQKHPLHVKLSLYWFNKNKSVPDKLLLGRRLVAGSRKTEQDNSRIQWSFYLSIIICQNQCFGSAAGSTDPTPNSNFFFCKRYKTHNDILFLQFWAYYSQILNKISDFFSKKCILIILVDLYVSLSRFYFWYSDPDQRCVKWIRITPNDTDPTGSGSKTLGDNLNCILLYARHSVSYFNKYVLTASCIKIYTQSGTFPYYKVRKYKGYSKTKLSGRLGLEFLIILYVKVICVYHNSSQGFKWISCLGWL